LTIDAIQQRLLATPGEFWRSLERDFFLNPWFYGVIVSVLLLERWMPADPRQSLLSKGTRQDLVWVPFKLLLHAGFFPAVVVLLTLGYHRYLGFLTIEAVKDWPVPLRFGLGWLAGDFLFWLIHLIRHKVGFLWHFHAIHHSQRQLNFFTEYRVHPLDDLWAIAIGAIPVLMLSQATLTVAVIAWIAHWHTRIYHSNIRTHFGPLKYVLVTPQSHRVHHSIEPGHQDKNFGLTFSIWDHLFGTQHRNDDEYPQTGVAGLESPTFLQQLVYPFQKTMPADR